MNINGKKLTKKEISRVYSFVKIDKNRSHTFGITMMVLDIYKLYNTYIIYIFVVSIIHTYFYEIAILIPQFVLSFKI